MSLEAAKTIAAFLGLGLGVLNLGILIYKEFRWVNTISATG